MIKEVAECSQREKMLIWCKKKKTQQFDISQILLEWLS